MRQRRCDERATSSRDRASQRQTAPGLRCVPPTQRSMPSTLDAIGVAGENAAAEVGDPDLGPSEHCRVPERWRRRSGVPLTDSTSRTGPEPSSESVRWNQVSPRNGAGSSACAATKAAAGVRAPGLERAAARGARRRESPSPRPGSSSSRRSSAAPRNGSSATPTRASSASPARLGRAHGLPGENGAGEHVPGRGAPQRPERLELGRRSARRARGTGPPGKRVDHDQLAAARRHGRRLRGEREHVEELQLVEQVVLEPEHDRLPVLERLAAAAGPALREPAADRRRLAPTARREERSARVEQRRARAGAAPAPRARRPATRARRRRPRTCAATRRRCRRSSHAASSRRASASRRRC